MNTLRHRAGSTRNLAREVVGYCLKLTRTQRDPPIHGIGLHNNMRICLGISRATPVNHNRPLLVVMSCSWVTRMPLHPLDWGMERPINESLKQQYSMMTLSIPFQSSDLIRLVYLMSAHAGHEHRREWRGSITCCLTAEALASPTFDFGGFGIRVVVNG